MDLANLKEGAAITGVRAEASIGDSLTGGLTLLDRVDLASAEVPRSEIRFGVAPAGAGPEGVSYDTIATLASGAFQKSLPISSLPPGSYDLWAMACLGTTCGPPVAAPFTR